MRRTLAPVALLTAAVLLVGPAASAASDLPPLVPGAEGIPGWGFDVDGLVVSGDLLYAMQVEDSDVSYRDTVLFSRSLAEDDDTVTLGAATRIGRASGFTLAEHDGTVAYLRRVDGRLVLRAADGTETMPAWGADPAIVTWGPSALTDSWLATDRGLLFDRATGRQVDLLDWIDGTALYPVSVDLTDDAAFVLAMAGDWPWRYELYTVPLGASGPTGRGSLVLASGEEEWFTLVGVVGDRLVWTREAIPEHEGEYQNVVTVLSVPTADPTSPPQVRDFIDEVEWVGVYNAGAALAVVHPDGSAQWLDPATLATDRTGSFATGDLTLPIWVHGTLGVHAWWADGAGNRNGLVDGVGRTIVASSAVPAGPPSFTDVPAGNQFAADVSWLADLGITTGYDDGGFHPTEAVSRQAMAAFLYRLAGEPSYAPPSVSPFADVATSHPFYKQISWLASTGISTGTRVGSVTYFKPADPVTRQAMAAFLYRFAGEPPYSAPTTSPFADVPRSNPFYAAIAWLADAEISTGTTVGNQTFYKPVDAVSRQAMAAFMHRLHTHGWTVGWHVL